MEGKIQRKERYKGRKDTAEVKIQRNERYRERKDFKLLYQLHSVKFSN